jgi:hypothetical protein
VTAFSLAPYLNGCYCELSLSASASGAALPSLLAAESRAGVTTAESDGVPRAVALGSDSRATNRARRERARQCTWPMHMADTGRSDLWGPRTTSARASDGRSSPSDVRNPFVGKAGSQQANAVGPRCRDRRSRSLRRSGPLMSSAACGSRRNLPRVERAGAPGANQPGSCRSASTDGAAIPADAGDVLTFGGATLIGLHPGLAGSKNPSRLRPPSSPERAAPVQSPIPQPRPHPASTARSRDPQPRPHPASTARSRDPQPRAHPASTARSLDPILDSQPTPKPAESRLSSLRHSPWTQRPHLYLRLPRG